MNKNVKNAIKALINEVKKENSILLDSPFIINESSILKEKYPFKAVFIFGPAGAGKTYIKNMVNIPKEFVDVSSDERLEDIFKRFNISLKFAYDLPKTPENEILLKTQLTARKIAQAATGGHKENMLFKGAPIIIDTTGEDVEEVVKQVDALVHLGYDVGILQINVPTEFSIVRDKERPRTIGKTYIGQISNQYQEDVVSDAAYFTQFQARKNVTLFGNDIFPNIFCLNKGGCPAKNEKGEKTLTPYGKLLPGITDDMLQQTINTADGSKIQPFKAANPQTALNILTNIESDVRQFLTNASAGPINPVGRKIFYGMKALVKLSGGKLGQRWSDLIPALAVSEFAQNDYIVAAAAVVADITEVDIKDVLGKERLTDTGAPYGSGGQKAPDVPTVRSHVKDMNSLKEIVKSTINDIKRSKLK